MARDEWGKASPEEGIPGGREFEKSVIQEISRLLREGPRKPEAVILTVGPSKEEIALDATNDSTNYNAGRGTFAYIKSQQALFKRLQIASIWCNEHYGTPSWEGVVLKLDYPGNLVNVRGPGTKFDENVLREDEKADEKTIFSDMTDMPWSFNLLLHGIRDGDDSLAISYDRFDPDVKCKMGYATDLTDSAIGLSKLIAEFDSLGGRAALGTPVTCHNGSISEEFQRSSKIGATYGTDEGTDEGTLSDEDMDDRLGELAKILDSITVGSLIKASGIDVDGKYPDPSVAP